MGDSLRLQAGRDPKASEPPRNLNAGCLISAVVGESWPIVVGGNEAVSSETKSNAACANLFELGPDQALQFPWGRVGTLSGHRDDRFRQGCELSAVWS